MSASKHKKLEVNETSDLLFFSESRKRENTLLTQKLITASMRLGILNND
jgi:hypothetical protein